MSKTDNTRPIEVQKADPRVKTLSIVIDDEMVEHPIMSGLANRKGAIRHERRQRADQRRTRDKKVKHEARYAINPEDVDVMPVAADRRCVGWRHLSDAQMEKREQKRRDRLAVA